MATLLHHAALGAWAVAGIAMAAADVPIELLGQPAVPEQAQRTIVISPSTRCVSVNAGDIVRFVVDGRAFGFDFDGTTVTSFTLNRVAPIGMLDHEVTVYVARKLVTQP